MLKFGHMSSDLLAYGASDGTLTVCTVSEKPSVIKQLNGHSKDVTGWIDWYCFFGLYLILHDPRHMVMSALSQYHLMSVFFALTRNCASRNLGEHISNWGGGIYRRSLININS